MISDLRFAVRSLLKTPAFTTVAILTLALGLGVNTTVFGLLNEFLLRPLPVPDADEIVFVMRRNPKLINLPFTLSYPDFLDLRTRAESTRPEDEEFRATFASFAAYLPHAAHLSGDGSNAERGWVHEVSDNYFRMLRVEAEFGRLFEEGEGVRPNADAVAVLADAYWRQHFNADRKVIGQKLFVNGAPFTIIGVARRGFGGAEASTQAQVFVPASMWDQLRPEQAGGLAERGRTSHMVIARLRRGIALPRAQAVADGALQQLITAHPGQSPAATAVLIAERYSRPSPYVSRFTGPAVGALMVLGLLVLAVAAANIANLLYARATDAERSLAIRSALGATRARLVRQLVAESVIIAVAAAGVGWIGSSWFAVVLADLGRAGDNPPLTPPAGSVMPVLLTIIVALLTGVATGLLPAWRATRLDVVTVLKQGTAGAGRTRHPMRTMLVGAQMVIACVVLVCAGLALQSLRSLARVNLGFNPRHVLIATFDLQMQRYSRTRAEDFQRRLLERVRALPGVREAGIGRNVPFDRMLGLRGGIGAEGYVPAKDEQVSFGCVAVSPRYAEALELPLLAGRTFMDADTASAPAVAIISQSVAHHFWPGQDPIGRRLAFESTRRPVEVVGLIPDVRFLMMTEAPRPLIFLPLTQDFSATVTLVVRTEQAASALAPSVLRISQQLDPHLPVHNVAAMTDYIDQNPLGLMVVRIGTIIAATQGLLVLLLSTMGVYSLVAFAVSRRTREIGIRIALGATAPRVIALVARPSLLLTAAALCLGSVVGVALSRMLSGLLYGGGAGTAGVIGIVMVLLVGVTLLACWLPARRATRVNPVDALRAE